VSGFQPGGFVSDREVNQQDFDNEQPARGVLTDTEAI
jgi:hypothetical protein